MWEQAPEARVGKGEKLGFYAKQVRLSFPLNSNVKIFHYNKYLVQYTFHAQAFWFYAVDMKCERLLNWEYHPMIKSGCHAKTLSHFVSEENTWKDFKQRVHEEVWGLGEKIWTLFWGVTGSSFSVMLRSLDSCQRLYKKCNGEIFAYEGSVCRETW